MISPIGYFIVTLNNALMAAISSLVSAMATWIATPLSYCACFYLLVQGVRLASGDMEVAHGLVLRLVRVTIIVWLATNLTAYTTYVQQALCTDLPNAISAVVTSANGASADVNSVASSFDNVYAQIVTVVSMAWQAASSLSFTGLAMFLTGVLALLGGGLGLLVMLLVWIASKLMLAVMICLGPLLIACGLFDWSRVFLERAIGKVVSLILLQVVTFLLVSLMISMTQTFLVKVSNDSILAAAHAGALPPLLEDLAAMVVWFVGAAIAAVYIPHKIAYSIGTGVSLAGPSLIGTAMVARGLSAIAGGGRGDGGGGSGPSAPLPNYSLSLAIPQLSGRAPALAPPAPPPSLASSHRS